MVETDVVVVGSGAGGAPVAKVLAERGANVVLLEKGPRHARKDFVHDEIAMCRRDFFTPFVEDDPHTLRRSENDKIEKTNAGWISQCVGGGTVHMSGFFFRFHEADFDKWPFDYAQLAPWYQRVEEEIGVSGDVSANPHGPPRSKPFPDPPVITHPVAAWIDHAGEKLGMHPFAVPRAIITQAREGRSACMYCPLCGSYGCEVGAKSSTLEALIPAAEKTGRCKVVEKAMVQRVLMMRNGRAKGVRYVDHAGQTKDVHAKIVVVACSAIESARLLMMSGVGNDQVGRNLTFSTLGQLTGQLRYEDFDEGRTKELAHRAPFVGRAVQDFYADGTFHLLWEHPNPIHAASRLLRDGGRLVFGAPLMQRLQKHFVEGRSLEVECFSEWRANPGCYVSLDDRVTDRWGLPAARITLGRDPEDLAASKRVVGHARKLLEAMGAKDIRVLVEGGETFVLQHGTCRMGVDPTTSVTTPQGNLHDIENVYVTDGGSLPSSGAVPSTLTIMANAFRIADGIPLG